MISEDLPEPDTPVMQVKVPSGKRALTSFRLFIVAPSISSHSIGATAGLALPCTPFLGLRGSSVGCSIGPDAVRLRAGMAISSWPERYLPVSEPGFAAT